MKFPFPRLCVLSLTSFCKIVGFLQKQKTHCIQTFESKGVFIKDSAISKRNADEYLFVILAQQNYAKAHL